MSATNFAWHFKGLYTGDSKKKIHVNNKHFILLNLQVKFTSRKKSTIKVPSYICMYIYMLSLEFLYKLLLCIDILLLYYYFITMSTKNEQAHRKTL